MTMTATPMTDLTADALADAIAGAALPVLRTALQKAKPRHRARVTDLPLAAMVRACAAMQDAPDFVARMLANTPSTPYEVTATKLIELRNGLDKPLLVFLPPGLRTAAEDSLDVATFQEISLQRLTGVGIV